ncbi:MAG: DUF3516 domain-containing protein [Atopobiaceae bacterium]|jgi:hypothetical protein|nr:DUF3516 domain-containing protein [Atopobiaceae bacterium]MCH4181454.1 DUF3516 domain-containing protein [Atopobiaceae bacterium]MCH4213489.1 DUF3516 domain-containing protein [Atopobiaceae bacterium]MCH4229711.1 DUF3516 domain-containing protein [Atopobiaceae bacterium]MCI1226465.1 DUF3516 domain-containing protein [Atopobiaceae bacterium]
MPDEKNDPSNTAATSGPSADGDPIAAAATATLGALVPDLWYDAEAWPDYEPEPALSADEALERFLGWVDSRGIQPWSHQEEALMDLMVGDHVILGTPTGSGKSLVALGLLFMSACQHRRSYYTAPIKALVSEKFFELVDVLGPDMVGMITGDTHINTDAPVICCTEEILANQALREGADADVAAVAMDEFHYFGDAQRGWAWQVPLITLPHTQFLLMSATLGDVGQVKDLLDKNTDADVDLVLDAPRPVPLSFEYVDTPLEATVELALRKQEAPLYLVHFSQDAALATAQSLANFGIATKEQRGAIKEAMEGTRFTTAFGKTLRRLLTCGVGVHHAGMLPRYRLLVEKLAQAGLLPVICGTDTLGVGINVPIHTVVLTALVKYDGHRMRRLRSREFHQIAGRAGRAGFDTEGLVLVEAPEHEIENARMLAKAGDDPKKQRKVHRKKAPEGHVTWNRQGFEHLVGSAPETLVPRLRITHSMVLAEVEQGGDARARVMDLIEASAQTAPEKVALATRTDEILATLIDADVIERREAGDGTTTYETHVDLPDDFALDQPLSPFLLAALELLDPESETYALDVISMVEATLEDPHQVLRAQERAARDRAMSAMKADGVEYDERMERIAEVTYPKPLEELLEPAFERYCAEVPWAADYVLAPKSVVREMVETASDFKGYIARYGIAKSEGTLLRYLSDAYRALDRTVPAEKVDNRLADIISWLGLIVRTIDSSLVDEWEAAGAESEEGVSVAAPDAADEVVHDRRGLRVLVHNALLWRVRLASLGYTDKLGEADGAWGFGSRAWSGALDGFHAEHDELVFDADARSWEFFSADESDERGAHLWHVRQMFNDSDAARDFGIAADVDLDASQDEGEAIFENYRVGTIEELTEP